MKALALGLVLFAGSCGRHEQAWGEKYGSNLRCGMSVPEAQALAGRPVMAASSKPGLGTHRVDGKWHDLWFTFRDDRLVSVISATIDGLTSARLSPKRNLCTGELTFFLNLEWVVPLQGADVFLDGKVVEENAASGLTLEVSSGNHELRVVKEGHEPIVKHLRFEATDPGRRRITLKGTDVVGIGRAGGVPAPPR
jgi:hypothetical protein